MKDYKSHRSILLICLLVFPMVYQTLHLVHEHGQCVAIDISPRLAGDVETFHDELNDCLICEFDYVVFDDRDQIHSGSKLSYLVINFPVTELDLPFLFDGFNNSLRAPPAIL